MFNRGDFFTVQDELKMVTENVMSNAQGAAIVSFKPALRKPINAGPAQIVELQNPYCLMRATEDDVASWALAAPVRQSSNFEVIEAVDI